MKAHLKYFEGATCTLTRGHCRRWTCTAVNVHSCSSRSPPLLSSSEEALQQAMGLCFELAEVSNSGDRRHVQLRTRRGADKLRTLHSVDPGGWGDSLVWTRETLGGLCQPQAR